MATIGTAVELSKRVAHYLAYHVEDEEHIVKPKTLQEKMALLTPEEEMQLEMQLKEKWMAEVAAAKEDSK